MPTYLDLFTTYLPINLKNNNPKNDFNLSIKLTQSNNLMSFIQIVNHFVNQNNKVQIHYPVTLACPNWIIYIDKVVFFILVNLVKKPWIVVVLSSLPK